MRLIDADELLEKFCHGCPDNENGDNCIMNHCADYDLVVTMPTVDAVSVVRCKDCFHYHHGYGVLPEHCALTGWKTEPSDYCSSGERKDEILTYTINAGEV